MGMQPLTRLLPVSLVFLALIGASNCSLKDNPQSFQIGGVLSRNESRDYFKAVIDRINLKPNYVPYGMSLVATAIKMDVNPIRTALDVCQNLIAKQVYAVVVSHPTSADLSPAAVSYTSGFYHIPVIGITSRDSAFSDKNIHVSFLRTVPPYSHQADVWIEILKHFKYQKVIFVHSSDSDGRSILGRLQTNAQMLEDDVEIKIESVVELEPGADSYVDRLSELRNAQARVYLVYASASDGNAIFRAAHHLNLTGAGHVWLVTEQLLQSSEIPIGAFGLQLMNAHNETAHIYDSLHVLAAAIKDMNSKDNITEAPRNCSTTGATWDTGRKLFEYIKNEELLDGETGKVAFDESGDRINAEYNVVNVQSGGKLRSIGRHLYSKDKKEMDLVINDSKIVWPGDERSKPEGLMIPTHLRILTIEEIPFVFVRKVQSLEECKAEEEYCPHFNTTEEANPVAYCCRGYCIDLLKELRKKRNFTFTLALSPDGQFGSYLIKNGTTKKEWTGLIGELVNERADMIVAPLTINPERAQAIEFSKPFKYQGITILVKRAPRKPTLVSFLQPFRGNLWILVMLSVHVVALVLYLLDRFSPFGRYRLANMDGTEEDALNLSSAIWFAWGVLLNSGIGEGTPRSFAARVLGIVWAGFAMIIVASYTANLAAFLVLDRPKTVFSGIHDNRLRNPTESFNYSTVKGSAVDMYFRRQVELSNMYRVMERRNYDTAQAAIDDIKKGTLGAFIWDSSRLQYEAARNCELITSGELFGRSGYAIGLTKNSPWSNDITLDILDFHESGFMEQLDKKWIIEPEPDPSNKQDQCPSEEKIPTTLGLENMDDAFILIAAVGTMGGRVHCGGDTLKLDDGELEYEKGQRKLLGRLQRQYRHMGGDSVVTRSKTHSKLEQILALLRATRDDIKLNLQVATSPANKRKAEDVERLVEDYLHKFDEYSSELEDQLREFEGAHEFLEKMMYKVRKARAKWLWELEESNSRLKALVSDDPEVKREAMDALMAKFDAFAQRANLKIVDNRNLRGIIGDYLSDRQTFFAKQQALKRTIGKIKMKMEDIIRAINKKYDSRQEAAARTKMLTARDATEARVHVLEMKELKRLLEVDAQRRAFMSTKNHHRDVLEQEMIALQRAYEIRNENATKHLRGLARTLRKILKLTGVRTVDSVVQNYRSINQETRSKFRYLVDLHDTVLSMKEDVARLEGQVDQSQEFRQSEKTKLKKEIRKYQIAIKDSKDRLKQLKMELSGLELVLRNDVIDEFRRIFEAADCSLDSISHILGSQSISEQNLMDCMRVVEHRIDVLKEEREILIIRQTFIDEGAPPLQSFRQGLTPTKLKNTGGPFLPNVLLSAIQADNDDEDSFFSKSPKNKEEMKNYCLQILSANPVSDLKVVSSRSIGESIAGGLVLILIEIFYKKHQLKRQRELEIARYAADKWRQTISQRKLDRDVNYGRRYKENGPPPFWAPGLDLRQRSPIAAKAQTIFV